MAKKRKTSSRNNGPKELDDADARLGPISTFEDVADSEDEYFLNQDRIMLDDEPRSKKRRNEDDDMEFSDEEILAYEDSESSSDRGSAGKLSKNSKRLDGDLGDTGAGEDEEDSGWWGSSKQEYYDADNIETEADALEEEAEAKRLQRKKLSKMREEDFVFDGDEWLTRETGAEDDEADDKIVEVLKDLEVTPDMTTEERLRLLTTRYPEFEHLANELEQLQPTLFSLGESATHQPETSLQVVKYWVLTCYVAALISYFAIFTSPARDASGSKKPFPPAELRDHDVMDTLLSAGEAWDRVKNLKSAYNPKAPSPVLLVETADDEAVNGVLPTREHKHKPTRDKKDQALSLKARAKKLKAAQAIESSVADLYNIPLPSGNAKRKVQPAPAAAEDEDNISDFGEEDAMDERTAADKAARKKSLKFYTSQIAQKVIKRAGAGRDAGGDMDIPHRERLRDRQARLLAAAEKRGKKGHGNDADLGNGDDSDEAVTNASRGIEDDDYYDMVARQSKSKREDKASRFAAYAAASKGDRVVETEEVGEDGKRKITYAIEKNKGLAPNRGKQVRNPRVKKRKQYEAKMKKLKSMKPVWQGGEPKGGYRGELSGINTGVVKSIKL